jgi:putative endonuclease
MFLQEQDKERKSLGVRGEACVAKYLAQRGFRVLAQNVHTRWGEIDILAQRNGRLHVVEVKTRSSFGYGDAATALTRTKFFRLRKSMQDLLQRSVGFHGPWQIDFATVEVSTTPAEHATVTVYWNVGLDDVQ